MENNPQGEIDEMIEIYEGKGFSKEDATVIISTMAKNTDFFIDHMCVQELGIMAPDEDDSPLKQGGVMFISFMLFGCVPLLAYVCFETVRPWVTTKCPRSDTSCRDRPSSRSAALLISTLRSQGATPKNAKRPLR